MEQGWGLDYKRLREMISIRRVLDALHFHPISMRGDQCRGACPLRRHHESDRHRCFSVHLTKNVFRCTRCNVGGNQLDLWVAYTHLSLYQASLDLCFRLGITPPYLARICNGQTRTRRTTKPKATGCA